MTIRIPWQAYAEAVDAIASMAANLGPGEGVRDALTQAARDAFARMIQSYAAAHRHATAEPGRYAELLAQLDGRLASLDREVEQYRRDKSRDPS